jgi:hypothetical protein
VIYRLWGEPSFCEPFIEVDSQPATGGKWLDRGPGALIRTRDNVIDAERRKLLSELHCLGGTRLRQRCFGALTG